MIGQCEFIAERQADAWSKASAEDRAWFLAHPGRKTRIRRAIFGEFPAHPDFLPWVVVRQMDSVSRIRVPFMTTNALPEGEAPEGPAAWLLAQLAPEVLRIEAEHVAKTQKQTQAADDE